MADDDDYFRARLSEELRSALEARDAKATALHVTLANAYAVRLAPAPPPEAPPST